MSGGPRPLRAALAAVALAALAFGASGCGDPLLWERWQAERALWHARAEAAKLPGAKAEPARVEQVAREAERVRLAYPAARWASPPAAGGAARHVALASGGAALLWAELPARGGDDSTCAARLAVVLEEYAALSAITIPAHLSRAAALQRLGRFDEALAEREAVAAMDPMTDDDLGGPAPEVVESALQAAHELERRGMPERAEALFAATAARYVESAARVHGRDSLVLCDALALLHVHRGLAAEALAGGRRALERAPQGERAARVLVMAQGALDAGAPDSEDHYARWAAQIGSSRRVVGNALFVAAQAWERLGRADSAIAAYDAVLRRWVDPGALGAPAHFERARLLERRGDWINARAEYLALSASQPTHPLAFRAVQRLVQHPFEQGEAELARVQGQQEIEKLGYLVATNFDPQVRRQAGLVRAELLLVTGQLAGAESSFVALWRQFPGDSATEDAALRGARLGAHLPGGAARSREVLEALSRRALDPVVRRSAAEELLRLTEQ
ncbi:MAG: hypothetical protein HZA61_15590 [Candidatus Eisenbacteria bacterium]|uniref:Tetratricopeptide repeat protein n=1 Tax=Eiseniibacteriota bacterium TaxID=2212470 RepID=A0A933SE54_UNCEI|nr:hypothetical protein [Candidatus Eisenbacteria bacterium]